MVEPEAFSCDREITLHCHFGDAVRIDRSKRKVFGGGVCRSSVDCRARGIYETVDTVIDAGVDEVGASDNVDFVVVSANIVTQAFRREPREMKHVDEAVLAKKAFDTVLVENRPMHEIRASVQILSTPATHVVEDDHSVPLFDQNVDDMGSKKPGAARNEDLDLLRAARIS